MTDYDKVRLKYKPSHIKYLMVAESPPPPSDTQSSRQFYYTDRIRRDDRLFVNTMQALYGDAADLKAAELEAAKTRWLGRFKNDGWYMIEALEESQEHEVTKKQRQAKIAAALPKLIERVRHLAGPDTKLILLKSNVFEVGAEPLRAAGFNVLNKELVDYPGRFNQRAYREKLAALIGKQTN
jgi:hypothetical protein